MKPTCLNMLLISLLIPLGTAWGSKDNANDGYTPSTDCVGKTSVREQYNCEVEKLKVLTAFKDKYCANNTQYNRRSCKDAEKNLEAQQQLVDQAHTAYAQSIRASNAPVTNVGSSDMASSEGPKKNCGNYGGEDCEATKEINTVALEGQKLIDNMGAGAVALKSADEQSKLAKKGSSATIKDAETTRKEMAQFAAWKSTGTTALVSGMAYLQSRRANKHKKSAQNIEIEANRRLVENNEKMAKLQQEHTIGNCAGDEGCLAAEKNITELENQNKNILNNSELEIAAQRGARAKANMGAVVTSITASKHAFEAARLGMVANSDLLSETTASAPTFSITQNSGEVIHNPDGQGTNPTPESAAVNVTDTGDKPNDKFDGGLNDFNPNFNDQTLTGNLPSGEGGAVNAPGAQGGGSGAGGAGGTSAANDSGGGGQEGPTGKTQAGKYESGEGGGSRFSRGGGSAVGGKSVGMDDGFADLLKKFLPGAQEERAPAEGEAVADANDDRTPASDRASVISREKNIFKEISKRYLKKNSEGSVLFQ